jgi:hypothetical protein
MTLLPLTAAKSPYVPTVAATIAIPILLLPTVLPETVTVPRVSDAS